MNTLSDKDKEELEHIKWLVWHHQLEQAFERLLALQEQLKDPLIQSKIANLYSYLKNNENYLAFYAERYEKNLPVSSHAAESTVENLVNDRQTKDGRMLWTRQGAHHVLQIRAAIESQQWERLYPIFLNQTLAHKLQHKNGSLIFAGVN